MEQIDRILESVPVATHNQRGLATLHIGCTEECTAEIDATTLLAIAEASMSSEIYELMKRSDEVEVVEKAHRRPRFVEDCVREMIAGVVRGFGELDGESFVSARQENLETIHQHNVVAERHGLLSELRAEIDLGAPIAHQTTLEEWLDAGAPRIAIVIQLSFGESDSRRPLRSASTRGSPAADAGAGRSSSRGRRAR